MCRDYDIERLYCGKRVLNLDLRTTSEEALDESIARVERLLAARVDRNIRKQQQQENESCAMR